jgi:hypothetical protein
MGAIMALNRNEGGGVWGDGQGGAFGASLGPEKDTRRVNLTLGEFVQRRSAVEYYGVDTMEAINRKMIPREVLSGHAAGRSVNTQNFNTGGPISGGGQPEDGRPVLAVLSANRENMRALLDGSQGELFKYMAENPDQMEAISRSRRRS